MNSSNAPKVRIPKWAWVKVALHPAGDRLLVQTDRLRTEIKLDEFGFGQLHDILQKRQRMGRRPLPSEPGTPCQYELDEQRRKRDYAIAKWLRENGEPTPEQHKLSARERAGYTDDQLSRIEAIIMEDM